MIPDFDADGLLPPGIHAATLAEVRKRFGGPSEIRRVQIESVEWMIDLADRAGVGRIVLNGSFVTNIMEPNDVDCVLLARFGVPIDAAAEDELIQGLPFLGIALVRQQDFDYLVDSFFAADRLSRLKGMVEVI